MTVIKLEPILAKVRGKIPLTTLLPRGELERMREKLRRNEQSEDAPMSEHAAEFIAYYMLAFQAAWSLLTIPAFESLARQHEHLEEEFMSGGPPMSPIYDSYSSVHALVEIPVGIGSETPMSVLARLTLGNILATQRWTAHFSAPLGIESSLTSSKSQALPNPLPTEVEAALSAQLMAQLRRTLDWPIPMFQKKTLRQLARNPKTRPDAISWLREQERILRTGPPPSIPIDLRTLWAELGLDYRGLDTDPES